MAGLPLRSLLVANGNLHQRQKLQEPQGALDRADTGPGVLGDQTEARPAVAVAIGTARQDRVDGQRGGAEGVPTHHRGEIVDDPVIDPERLPAAPVAGAGRG
jgi:hypothetical protein